VHPLRVSAPDDFWIPLVDEPIGSIVRELQESDPEIAALVDSPRRLLAFRTFAYIRVGVLLGRLLVEEDLQPSEDWIGALLANAEHRARVEREVRAVAEEIAADPTYDREPVGPDDDARARFREFARRQLGPV
jgi:hypothetical protein